MAGRVLCVVLLNLAFISKIQASLSNLDHLRDEFSRFTDGKTLKVADRLRRSSGSQVGLENLQFLYTDENIANFKELLKRNTENDHKSERHKRDVPTPGIKKNMVSDLFKCFQYVWS